jgi:hypothetical protein
VSELNARDGCVVKNLGIRKSTYGTIQYILSHCGVWAKGYPAYSEKYHTAISWFGALSYNTLRLPKESRAVMCPLCGLKMQRVASDGVDWNGKDPPLESFKPAGEGVFLLDTLDGIYFPKPIFVPPLVLEVATEA